MVLFLFEKTKYFYFFYLVKIYNKLWNNIKINNLKFESKLILEKSWKNKTSSHSLNF